MKKVDDKDNLLYICTLIEYIARQTCNKRRDIVNKLSDKQLEHEIKAASVNHCLSFEQVSDEWIEEYDIQKGKFDNIAMCKYAAPTATSIGRIYQRLILDNVEDYPNIIETIRAVFNSFISDEISDFNSNVYYSNPDYLKWSYKEGRLLD